MKHTTREGLERVARELQALLNDVQELLAEEEEQERPKQEKKKTKVKTAKEIGVGDRVKVIRKDSYFGRVGIVKSLRGKMFVYIELEATRREEGRLIFKMRSSLKAVD